MDENRSLTDFAIGADESTGDSEVDGANGGAEAEDDAAGGEGTGNGVEATEPADDVDTDAVDPAVSTYRWSSEGAACADCGETVERRWRDGDEYVCGDCKEW